MTDLVIVDLGYGNLGSVDIAFRRLGLEPVVSADHQTILHASRVVLPGVGAAGYAMARIEALGLAPVLRSLRQPLLGICLGMQLMFERSEEGDTLCLGLLPGEVRRLQPGPGISVPHMGWSALQLRTGDIGLAANDYVYFAHSFACDDGPYTAAAAEHGRSIPAAVRKDNLWGAQFHPEKSATAGRRFIEAFLSS